MAHRGSIAVCGSWGLRWIGSCAYDQRMSQLRASIKFLPNRSADRFVAMAANNNRVNNMTGHRWVFA